MGNGTQFLVEIQTNVGPQGLEDQIRTFFLLPGIDLRSQTHQNTMNLSVGIKHPCLGKKDKDQSCSCCT